jgi:hypothetical protein
MVWTPADLREVARTLRADTAVIDSNSVRVISDPQLCARLARAIGRPGVPIYALRFRNCYAVIPAGRGELPDELTVLSPQLRPLRAGTAKSASLCKPANGR